MLACGVLACSSEPPTVVVVIVGPDAMQADSAGDDTAPFDSGTPEPDTFVPVDTAPEDTGIADTARPDTWTPPPDTYVPPADTYVPPDTTPPPDTRVPTLEETRCLSGAPRLSWDGARCIDTAPPFGSAAPCVFRPAATSGEVRCLPVMVFTGPQLKGLLGGSSTCTGLTSGHLLDVADFTTAPSMASTPASAGKYSVYRISEVIRPLAYTWVSTDTCARAAYDYPFHNTANRSMLTGDRVAETLFVATTL